MFIRQIDYLSPTITFYHKGILSHSSIISGILTIISFVIIISIAVYFSLDIIKRKNPQAFYFNKYVEDSGIFPFNSSSFFHFISLSNNPSEILDVGVDFTVFRVIGIDTYFHLYLEHKNLSKIDHWLYGFCNNDTDTKGIGHLITHNFFNNSACIRKYFNANEQKYYETDDPKFKWPTIAHGTYNLQNKFYSIVIEKCKNDTISKILGEGSYCKSEETINEFIGLSTGAHLFYIENYIDVSNYNNPSTKMFSRLESSIEKNAYSINHLNFNPYIVRTYNGLIFENIEEEISYIYERNDVFTYNDNKDENIYCVYYFWLNNRMNHYERFYKRIQDLFSNIGGISQFITIFATYLNRLYNYYIVLLDTEQLLFSSIDSEKNENNNHLSRSKKIKDININNYNISEINKTQISQSIKDLSNIRINNRETINSNEKNKSMEKNVNMDFINNNISNGKFIKNKTFFTYLYYKLTCGNNNKYYKIYEHFRINIISEEHLIKNHLNIYNLLKVTENKRKNYKKRYSYNITDLIRLV